MAITSRSSDAPLDQEAFSGGARLTDGFLRNFLQTLETRFYEAIEGAYAHRTAYRNVSGTVTVAITDKVLGVDVSGAAATLNLPAVADVPDGMVYIINDEEGNAATYNITIDPASTEQIDGSGTLVLSTNGDAVMIYSDGSAWHSLAFA